MFPETGFFAVGYDAALDEHKRLRSADEHFLSKLQDNYRQKTGINTLKIRFNNIVGYFCEISAAQEAKLERVSGSFTLCQTTSNLRRYKTDVRNFTPLQLFVWATNGLILIGPHLLRGTLALCPA